MLSSVLVVLFTVSVPKGLQLSAIPFVRKQCPVIAWAWILLNAIHPTGFDASREYKYSEGCRGFGSRIVIDIEYQEYVAVRYIETIAKVVSDLLSKSKQYMISHTNGVRWPLCSFVITNARPSSCSRFFNSLFSRKVENIINHYFWQNPRTSLLEKKPLP